MRTREIERNQTRKRDMKETERWFTDGKISDLKKIGVDAPELKKAIQAAFSLPSDSRNGNWYRKLLQLLDFQLDRPHRDQWHHVGKDHPLFNWCKDQRTLLDRELGPERTDSDYRRLRISALHAVRFPKDSQTAIRLNRGRIALACMQEAEIDTADNRPGQLAITETSSAAAECIPNDTITTSKVAKHDSPAANDEESPQPTEQTGFSF